MTQVSRDGTPQQAYGAAAAQGGGAGAAQKGGFLNTLCCCCGGDSTKHNANGGAAQPAVQQQQQQSMMAAAGASGGLLGPQPADLAGRKCLVLDLDETLVHSSFKPVPNPDYIVPIEIDGQQHRVYVLKRPHVDKFLAAVGKLYEVVLFTASLSKYADPVTDLLDPNRVCRFRLFREHCVFHRGSYVKDLSRLGRPLHQTIIVDNSPASYIFQPENAVPCKSWFDDRSDTELLELIPFFENMAKVDDVKDVLRN